MFFFISSRPIPKVIRLILFFLLFSVTSSLKELNYYHVDEVDWIDPGDLDVTANHQQVKDGPTESSPFQNQNSEQEHLTSTVLSKNPTLNILYNSIPNQSNTNKETLPTKTSSGQKKDKEEIFEHELSKSQTAQLIKDSSNTQICENTQSLKDSLFLKKIFRFFADSLNAKSKEFSSNRMCFDVDISSHQLKLINKFLEEENANVQDAHDALINSIKRFRSDCLSIDAPEKFDTMFNQYHSLVSENLVLILVSMLLFLVASAIVYTVLKLRMSFGALIWWIFLLSFLVSLPWNWYHLYQEELVKQKTEVLKDIPPECGRFYDKGMVEKLSYFVGSLFALEKDQCLKYHKSLDIYPLLKIPPTKVLVVTITRFVLEPAEHLGEAIQQFVRATFSGLPLLYAAPLGISVLIFLFLLLTMAGGYRVSVLGLAGFEPVKRPIRDNAEQTALQRQIEALTLEMKELKIEYTSHSPSIPAPIITSPALTPPTITPAPLKLESIKCAEMRPVRSAPCVDSVGHHSLSLNEGHPNIINDKVVAPLNTKNQCVCSQIQTVYQESSFEDPTDTLPARGANEGPMPCEELVLPDNIHCDNSDENGVETIPAKLRNKTESCNL